MKPGKQVVNKGDILLPEMFVPSTYSVIVGKSRASKTAEGNARLKALASTHLAKYSEAKNKTEKSKIVSKIVDVVHSKCEMGAFIKYGKDMRWYQVPKAVAREKVGYCFRDLLHDKYKSSSASKALKRRLKKESSVQNGDLPVSPEPVLSKKPRRVSSMTESKEESISQENNRCASPVVSMHNNMTSDAGSVTDRSISPTCSLGKTESSYLMEPEEVSSSSTPYSSASSLLSMEDFDFVPDLEPLPFDSDQEEPLIDCGDIAVIIDDDENGEDRVSQESVG
ncbi:MAG: hypothetical protein SGILL_007065, partial [Bacillariaceae sp.]